MALKSKYFLLTKGSKLDPLAAFLYNKIGLDAHLIVSLQAEPAGDNTLLSVIYKEYDGGAVSVISPAPGSILSTGLADNDLSLGILFNDPIDPRSVVSGCVLLDGVVLPSGKYVIPSGNNNYYLKASLSGYTNIAYHDSRFDTTKIKRSDGSTFPHSFIGNYSVFNQSIPTNNVYNVPKVKIRGKVSIEVLRSITLDPQQVVSNFLLQRNIPPENLITYTICENSSHLIDTYICYVQNREPQIIESSPSSHSSLPYSLPLGTISLLFSTRLDSSHLTGTSGLFTIESGFANYTNIPPSSISILADKRTVRVNVSSYITSKDVYNIIAKPGIRSEDGFIKVKPDLWSVQLDDQPSTSRNADTLNGQSGSYYINAANLTGTFGASIPTSQVAGLEEYIEDIVGTGFLLFGSGIGGNYTDSGNSYQISGLFSSTTGHGVSQFNPASFSVVNGVVSFTGSATGEPSNNAVLTGHTGNLNIHFSQGDITGLATSAAFTDHTGNLVIHFSQGQITGLTASSLFVSHSGDFNNPHNVTAAQVGSPTTSTFSGHTGDSQVHFTLAQISITGGQVSDLTEYIQDTVGYTGFFLFGTGVTGSYNDVANTLSISGRLASTSAYGVAMFDPGIFIAPQGIVSISAGTLPITLLQDTEGPIFLGVSALAESPIEAMSQATAANLLTGTLATRLIVTGHTGDSSIHYTQGQITGLAPAAAFTTHTGNNSIHFTAAQVDHNEILNVGTYYHSDLDDHLDDSAIHYLQSQISITSGQVSNLTEAVQDIVGYTGFFSGQSGLSVQYNDASNTLAVGLSGNLGTWINQMPRTIYSSGNIHKSGTTAFVLVPLFTVDISANTMNLYGAVDITAIGQIVNLTGGTVNCRIVQSGIHHTGWGDGYGITGNLIYPTPFSYRVRFANTGARNGNYLLGNLELGDAQRGNLTGLGNIDSTAGRIGLMSSVTGLDLDTSAVVSLTTSNYWAIPDKSAYIKIFHVNAVYFPGMT